MEVLSFLNRAIPFIAALSIGVFAAWLLEDRELPDSNAVSVREMRRFPPEPPGGFGISGPDSGSGEGVASQCPGTCNVKIFSKRRADYTDKAREHEIQGTVLLRVTFLASGEIGGIAPVTGLPYGLTEQAIAAAREIKQAVLTRRMPRPRDTRASDLGMRGRDGALAAQARPMPALAITHRR